MPRIRAHGLAWGAQYELGRREEAQKNLDKAVQVATQKGDKQTVKMAQVFLRRLQG